MAGVVCMGPDTTSTVSLPQMRPMGPHTPPMGPPGGPPLGFPGPVSSPMATHMQHRPLLLQVRASLCVVGQSRQLNLFQGSITAPLHVTGVGLHSHFIKYHKQTKIKQIFAVYLISLPLVYLKPAHLLHLLKTISFAWIGHHSYLLSRR